MKRFFSVVCAIALLASAVMPSAFISIFADNSKEVNLSDGSKWLTSYNESYNTLSTDNEGRYFITTTAPGSSNSAFSLLSGTVYPLSTKYQMRCREAANATTRFGLTTEYSFNLSNDNSIYFTRKNGSPSENAVKLYVTINGVDYCIVTTAANYTRNRVSTIGVTKKNGSWYMTWNNIVLDGEGSTDEVKEYCKLENHFPKDGLEANLSLHYYAYCSKMLATDSFSLKPDREMADGLMAVAPDSYTDPNNPATLTKTNRPTVNFDADNKRYEIGFTSNKTNAALTVPVTVFDKEKGESEIFNVETYLINHAVNSVQYIEYMFSNDPTFSDGTEISVLAARLANNQGIHLGYFDSNKNWIVCAGANNNFFNDPQNASRSWQFRTDKSTGKVYLYIWGANLISATAPFTLKRDFSIFTDKPIYMAVNMYNIGSTANVRIDVTPYNSAEVESLVAETEELATTEQANLEEAETIIASYDANPYRFAISKNGLSKILETRMYMYAEREKALKAKLQALKDDIDILPDPAQLENVYTEGIKQNICDAYLEYTSLGENMSRLESEYVDKLRDLINALTLIDSEFADMKSDAENFGNMVDAIGSADDIIVDNYAQKREKVSELRNNYENMIEFAQSLVSSETLEKLSLLEERLNAVKPAYDVSVLITQLPEINNIKITDEDAILEARKYYNLLAEPELISSTLVDKLTNSEIQLEVVKIRDLDWYSKYSDVKYTGNNADSYTFESTANKINGDVFATTTKTFNMKSHKLYWLGMGMGSGQFAFIGLTNSVKGQQVSTSSTDNFVFIMRPYSGNSIGITFFDKNGESERVAVLNGFDLAAMHIFEFVKGKDNHWYLQIDGNICDAFHYERFDNYMEQYGENTYVSIGARNGFNAGNVCIKDKNVSTDTDDWSFSLPYGCSSSGEKFAGTVNLKKGAQAISKHKIENVQNYEITLNMNLQNIKSTNTIIGLLANPDGFSNTKCSSARGVIIRIYNRPSTFPEHTHINVQFEDGTSVTSGFQPTLLDMDYIKIAVEKGVDNHYYMRLKWNGGSWLLKRDRSDKNYSSVHLDKLVENGAYLTVGTTSHDVSVDYSYEYFEREYEDEATEDIALISNFILEFEKYFDKLNKRDVKAYEYMNKKWLELDFMTRNSVIADLMDDEAAYNLLLTVMKYQDGDLDEFYNVTEEIYVTKEELEELVKEYEEDEEVDYTIINGEDGKVLYTIKNRKD